MKKSKLVVFIVVMVTLIATLSACSVITATHTVTFETSGGSAVKAQKIADGSFANQPTAPTKVGYLFDGWYKEASFATQFNFAKEKITADTTIYAKWLSLDNCLTFTFTNSSNSAYSVEQKLGATLPNSIDLPAEYNNKPIVAIGYEAFYKCSSLTSFTIPAGVTSIGYGAFAGCGSLTSLTVESGNTKYKSIDGNLYSKDGSTLLQYAIGKTDTNFTIPASVTSIGKRAFWYCSSLTSVTFEAGSKLASIGECAFESCSSLTSFTIPASVTSIGECAFESCRRLTSFTIPASVTSIDSYAFGYCSSLTSVTFEAGSKLASIGKEAFYECSSLTSFTIPASVTSIGNRAFYGCSSLTSLTVENGNTKYKSIDGNLYSKDGSTLLQYAIGKTDTSFTIPASVTSIGAWAFDGCSSLTSFTIPAGVTSIGYGAFADCSRLTSLTVESGNTKYKSIDGNLYSKDGSTLLQYAIGKIDTSFTIPAGVTSIGAWAFAGCSSLTSVTFEAGSKLASIGGGAFYNCSSLTSFTIPASVTSIGNYAFAGCSSLTIYVEAPLQPAGWSGSWNSDNCKVVWGHKI